MPPAKVQGNKNAKKPVEAGRRLVIKSENLSDPDSEESGEESEHSSDRDFIVADSDEWEEDPEPLCAAASSLDPTYGRTPGDRRLGAMIASIERRARARHKGEEA